MQILCAFRSRLPLNVIEMNTNGDRLKPDLIRTLYTAGLTATYVNCYDGPEQVPFFTKMFEEAGITAAQYQLRKHWTEGESTNFGLVLNNRSGTVSGGIKGLEPLTAPLVQQCFYPFYKMLIDWNGDALFCSNDWGRTVILGNVLKQSIRELWLSEKMFDIRKRLLSGNRQHKPCST